MLLTGLAAVTCLGTLSAANAPDSDRQYREKIQPLLQQYCYDCHSARAKKVKGDLRLDQLAIDLADKANRDRWQKVLEQLNDGEMPPKEKAHPSVAEMQTLTGWIATRVAAADATRRATEGRVVLRRLNRVEYENSVRDLLGVNTKLKELLPADSSAAGFDNVGDALHTSSFLMDRYLEAAETALNQAIVNRPKPPPSATKRYSIQEAHQLRSSKEDVFRKFDDGRAVMFSSSAWVAATLFYTQERGLYRFRISASGIQSGGQPVIFSVISGGGGMGGARGHLVNYFDAPAEKPAVIEFVDLMEPRTSITIYPYNLASAQTVNKVGATAWKEPGLAIDWVDVEGPLNEIWPPESHRRLFGDLPQKSAPGYNFRDRVEVTSTQPLVDADRILRPFIRRAFRRPVTDADVKPYVALVESALADKQSFEQAMRAGLAAVLTSPDFLFLRETPGKLDVFALASRLSYFFWSSLPDEELLSLAEQGKLTKPEVLRAQVERLLNSPKAVAFTENFLGQWLGLRDIDFTEPGRLLYPEFDDMLKTSMLRETELFFEEVLHHNLSLTNFIASDFSMLNGRLARHYGIPGVEGWAFKKVALPPESHRGGFLTMGSVLKITANGTSTSPVMRGAWVLDRMLGTPPPPPPENVSALEPDTRGSTTIRQRLAKHRQIESCASCHVKIDPPGFALESFDVIGGWRDNYRTTGNGKPVVINGRRMSYLEGPKVDCSDVLPDGRAFKNIDDLKQLLLADKDQITRALTTRLLTYATGGAPEAIDRPQLNAIVTKAAKQNYGFRSLVHEVVASELFQMK